MLEAFPKHIGYVDPLEIYCSRIVALLGGTYVITKRAIALLLLQEDKEITAHVQKEDGGHYAAIEAIVQEAKKQYPEPLGYVMSICRQKEASRIAESVVRQVPYRPSGFGAFLHRLLMNPFTGTPILLFILYFGLYKFVGTFGAGVLVNFLEDKIFDHAVSPFLSGLVQRYIPFVPLQSLLVGDYGIFTMGIRYACAIILPIVATFFLAFAIIEDTGYLPRLAMLVDQLFKRIGLSGRAVIPLVLGLGCSTMATMVTRTLPTKRERIIATLLLALAIPCSAQMGVIMALFAGHFTGLFVWLGIIIGVFVLVGFLASKIMPGELPSFYMEIPPLRLPHIGNVLRKTWVRLQWYFMEVLPLFILASIVIWLGQVTRLFGVLVHVMTYPVRWIGLPSETAVAFLFGFFRRDYGAAGLYDVKNAGGMTGNQLVVACVTLTLFLPCIAQLIMNVKERGMRMGIAISVFVLVFSFGVGFLVNTFLQWSLISL
ncbi:MAG TPA: ferrous iron transporter B [Candidatus Omnitrophota bacterium]|nr:ferrous iron transporter B [Candidatus Omnitrophota bacterium]HPT07887.1 ferrous iron transporter B [Candidatus Omnitrophota bacterium]